MLASCKALAILGRFWLALVKDSAARDEDCGSIKMAQQQQSPVLAPLEALPRDVSCHITSYLHPHQLLGLRCQSKHCRDAIRFAATLHAGCSSIVLDSRAHPSLSDARMHVARAFGHSCRQLEWRVTFYPPEPGYSNFNDIGYQRLVAWCGAAPNLIRLHAPCVKIDVETAAAIGRACPMLEEVKFHDLHCASPTETWARCFPRLRRVSLAGHNEWRQSEHLLGEFYALADLEAISETLTVCTSAVELDCRECDVSRPVIDRILGTPFGNRLRAINFLRGAADAETVLACARECPHLRGLVLPEALASAHGQAIPPSFYEALARARPELTYLKFCNLYVNYNHILAAVSHLRLRCLEIANTCGSGIHDPALVDGILASPSATTLELLRIHECEVALGGEDVLRLVNGCPQLHSFGYEGFGEGPEWDSAISSYDKAERILRRRRRRVGFSLKKYLPGSGLYRQVGVFRNVTPSFWNTQDRLTKYTSP